MSELFDEPAVIREYDLPDERDGRQWYKLKRPSSGDPMSASRVSTMAKVLEDTFGLTQWQLRMLLLGLTNRPDIVGKAHGMDVKADSKILNALVAEAKKSAGASLKADMGTLRHKQCEEVDLGIKTLEELPVDARADIGSYLAEMERHQVKVVPSMVERITYNSEFDTAGKFDRILQLPDGSYVIGDTKTGNVEMAALSIGVQLWLYATGVNTSGVWSKVRREWDTSIKVREDIGVVMHMPVGQGKCELLVVDLKQGEIDARLSQKVKERRKVKNRLKPMGTVDLSPAESEREPEPPTWLERFQALTSRQEASALYKEAKTQVSSHELARLVEVGKAALACYKPPF